MKFSSIEEIAAAFNLEGASPSEIRTRLRQRQAKIHPDRNGGEFVSKEQEEDYHRIEEAIEMLDANREEGSLIPVAALSQIALMMKDLIAPREHEDRQRLLAEKLSADIDRGLDRYRVPYYGPRLTVTGVTAVMTALWAFPSSVEQNPVLAQYINPSSLSFTLVWLYGLLITGSAWLLAWRQKERNVQLVLALKAEPYQNRLFEEFVSDSVTNFERTFRKDKLIEHIRYSRDGRSYHGRLRFISGRPVDYQTAQTTVDLIIERLEARGIIEATKQGGLSATYKIL